MTLATIILLILVGLVLLLLEIFFVPGMVLGAVSVMLMIGGIFFSYQTYGATVGTITLIATAAATTVMLYFAFKSNMWKKLQVQSTMEGKVPMAIGIVEGEAIKIGDTGKTISRLNPIGKAFINNFQIEVQAVEGFIDQEKEITVVKVQQNKIFVTLAK